MLAEDDEDSDGLGNIGIMSDRLSSEALFWRLVCNLKFSPSEVDKWTLDDMRLAASYMDMQNDYKRVWQPYYDIKRENQVNEMNQGG